MAKKETKKVQLPKIHKKWYDFTIDPKTLRPIRFSWMLTGGIHEVFVYNDTNKPRKEVLNLNLGRYIASYYFVLDKVNKRIYAYPVDLCNHHSRGSCTEAHYTKTNSNVFYMFDENKQIWEIPKQAYRRYVRYDWQTRQSIYEDIEAKPRKVSRISTASYKIQCQLTSHIRSIFSYLYGSDFVYQSHMVSDDDISGNNWRWHCWLTTKGRKYSDKTISYVNDLMDKISAESRLWPKKDEIVSNSSSTNVRLECNDGITVLCYFSCGKETFRQIYNAKTKRMENFIWKDNQWQKTSKLSNYLSFKIVAIDDSYKKSNSFDYECLLEASRHYVKNSGTRGYWYSAPDCLYKFIVAYLKNPIIHQLLQVSDKNSKSNIFYKYGCIKEMYGDVPNRGRTLYAKLGINKFQFENPAVIPYVKDILDTNNISHLDNETWNKCVVAFTGRPIPYSSGRTVIDYLKERGEFSLDRWMKICNLTDRVRTNYYNPVERLYSDYFTSLKTMGEFNIDISAYPLIFNDQDQLQRYHDEAARAVSAVKNKAQDEKFAILYAKREKMLENDGSYLIDMPKSSADLTTEGSYLRHCVGGYINRVANGDTAIYFLRQASEPNTPWLTVEVNNKRCIQIHGSCNAWMGSKVEYFKAVPFLVWWFEKHGIECNENLLTNMATGYSSVGSRRSMPTKEIESYKAQRKVNKLKKSS
jgi:hypothetical protein